MRTWDFYTTPLGAVGTQGKRLLLSTAIDITEKRLGEEQLRRSSALLTDVIHRSPTGFYIVDSQFRISHMNADSQARAFRNVNPAIGRRFDEAMHILWPEPLASELIAIFRHTLDTGEPYRSPGLVSSRADLDSVESYEWQLDRITMPDGTFAVVCYYYDTTQLRKAEAEARENAEGLRKLTAELSDADRRKDEFLATLAHELRNPLAPVMNSLAIMKHADSARQWDQARSTMERQVGQMVRLIDDLLDVSRITRNRLLLRLGRVELTSIVHHAVEACHPLYQSAGHTLSVDLPSEPIFLNADATRLAQVFGNLLNNSCKYSERNGKVRLTAERQGEQVIVKVKDSGIGIPKEMLPKVFDMFTQVHGAMERSEGGLGIGLSLVKRLVEMHDGTVTAHSDGPGTGSEFVVTLPVLSEVPASPVSEPVSLPKTPLARRILVVDDNRDSAESLALLLSLTGNETQIAHDGLEAVEKAGAYRPALILLDIGMPKMNGYEACRAIRQEPWGKEMVIIALTGWGQEEDRRKSKEAGFNGHLVKPVELSQLEKLLANQNNSEEGMS
ncbi:MAG: ATP-binding protein [Gemmatales bacterium]